jgi:hypothetical protein
MAPEVGVAFEVRLETGAPDQDWSVTLGYNKHVLLRTVETTEDDGGFEFTLVENNARGEDVGTVRMRNHVTAEVCWGRLRAEL